MANFNPELQRPGSFTFYGARVNDHKFVTSLCGKELELVAPDPRIFDNRRQLEVAPSDIRVLADYRNEIQRPFASEKRSNVERYAAYLIDTILRGEGDVPPPLLYSQHQLPVVQVGDVLPDVYAIRPEYGVKMFPLDGETFLGAYYRAAEQRPEIRDLRFAVTFMHGIPLDEAKRIFYVHNILGVRPSPAMSLAMNVDDAMTAIARVIEDAVPVLSGRVDKRKRQLAQTDQAVVTLPALRGAVINVHYGIGGVRFGAKPVPIDVDARQQLERVALKWFRALLAPDALGPVLERRQDTILGSPAVLAAVGAVGHAVYNLGDVHHRRAQIQALVEDLKTVDWTRGQHWTGIAGKYTPKGKFSVGGSKEVGYAVYTALTDRTSPSYQIVRRNRVAA